jgi:hypothetical protein
MPAFKMGSPEACSERPGRHLYRRPMTGPLTCKLVLPTLSGRWSCLPDEFDQSGVVRDSRHLAAQQYSGRERQIDKEVLGVSVDNPGQRGHRNSNRLTNPGALVDVI